LSHSNAFLLCEWNLLPDLPTKSNHDVVRINFKKVCYIYGFVCGTSNTDLLNCA
jgi:hypothetical protein